MRIAQSNSAGTVLGSPQGCRTWCGGPARKILFFFAKNKNLLRDSSEDLAGNVREVWGSTRGTPMPCHWFLEFVERQALRCYRTVVLGWTPLSQKPIPRPVAQSKKKKETEISSFLFGLFVVYTKLLNWDSGMFVMFPLFSFVWQCTFVQKIPCLTLRASNFLMKANHVSPPIVRRYLRLKPFHIFGRKKHFKSNRLSKERGLPAASTARSTWKIHEIFSFFSIGKSFCFCLNRLPFRNLWHFQTRKDSCLPDEFGVCEFYLEEQ